MNLKLCSLPESPELNNALLHNISPWLTSLLWLEGNVTPITSTYRVGAASRICPHFPRDVILQFLYATERDAVLKLACGGGALSYSGSKIIILLDLPQEILLKRKTLKPIIDQLKAKNIRFRWHTASDVVVMKDGTQYKVEDLASGHTLLAALDISLPPT